MQRERQSRLGSGAGEIRKHQNDSHDAHVALRNRESALALGLPSIAIYKAFDGEFCLARMELWQQDGLQTNCDEIGVNNRSLT